MPFSRRRPPALSGGFTGRAGRIIANRAAAFKDSFLANKTAGRAADRSEIPSALLTVLRVPGNLAAAVLAKKTGTLGSAFARTRHVTASSNKSW